MSARIMKGAPRMRYVGYYNGEMGPLEDLRIPALDRAVYFGDGCYEASTFANDVIFALDEHLERFYRSCRFLKIEFPLDAEALAQELQRCVDANELDSGSVYWQCSRGTYYRTHAFPPDDVRPNLMIFTTPGTITPSSRTFRLMTMEDFRHLHVDVKTLNLLPNVLAAQRCKEAGCDEAVLHRQGRVTDGSHSSILMLKDGVLIAPPRDNLTLPGITMAHLLKLAHDLGIPTREQPFTVDDLLGADEVIVSSSGAFCIRAASIDDVPVGGKDPERLKGLQEAYQAYYEQQTAKI